MAKQGMHLLAAREVQAARDGNLYDGAGLMIRIDKGRASAMYRFLSPVRGTRREMGLGSIHRDNIGMATRSLSAARELAEEARRVVRQGLDPIDERDRKRDQARRALELRKTETKRERATLARVARTYHEQVVEPNRTSKHSAQWIASLEQHVPADTWHFKGEARAAIWHAPIESITPPVLLDFFRDVTKRIPETGSRIIQRLIRVFKDAEFRGLCKGNAAMAAAQKLRDDGVERKRGEFAALPFAEVPSFVKRLREQTGVAARALEFGILTAARTGEILGATWPEFDLDAQRWVVPAARMKGGDRGGDHTVCLAPRAVEILREMRDLDQPYAFPSPNLEGRPLSNMSMLVTLRRMELDKRTTVHGVCRKTFSTWANETGAARSDVIEAALAHKEQNRIRSAYNKATYMAERRALAQAWADFIDGNMPGSNVVEFPQRAA